MITNIMTVFDKNAKEIINNRTYIKYEVRIVDPDLDLKYNIFSTTGEVCQDILTTINPSEFSELILEDTLFQLQGKLKEIQEKENGSR